MVVIAGRRSDTKVLRMKSCPKCKRGDIVVDRDHHGWYEYCIQCGYMRDLMDVVELGQEQTCGGKKAGKKGRASGEGGRGDA